MHGGVNRAILSLAIAGQPAFFGHVEQSPGCINVLDHGPDWFVRAMNLAPLDLVHAGPRLTSIEEMAADYRAFRASLHVPRRGGSVTDPAPQLRPIARSALPGVPSDGTTWLRGFGSLKGVGLIGQDEEWSFGPTGLTLVCGQNAVGKSSYVRALKVLCRAFSTRSK